MMMMIKSHFPFQNYSLKHELLKFGFHPPILGLRQSGFRVGRKRERKWRGRCWVQVSVAKGKDRTVAVVLTLNVLVGDWVRESKPQRSAVVAIKSSLTFIVFSVYLLSKA